MIYDFMTYDVMTYDVMRYDVMFQAYVFFSEGGFPKFKIFPISNFSQIRSVYIILERSLMYALMQR